jgi:heme A synthase
VVSVHRTLALVVVLLALGGTLWSAENWLRRGAISPRLTTATIAMSAVVGLQAVFGILLAVMGNRPADGVAHFLVGPLTLFALPVARRVAGARNDRSGAAILTVGWLGLLLLALRAVGSGGGLG